MKKDNCCFHHNNGETGGQPPFGNKKLATLIWMLTKNISCHEIVRYQELGDNSASIQPGSMSLMMWSRCLWSLLRQIRPSCSSCIFCCLPLTTKNAYYLFLFEPAIDPNVEFIWESKAPIKVKILLGSPSDIEPNTKRNLLHKKIVHDATCASCDAPFEDDVHLFI